MNWRLTACCLLLWIGVSGCGAHPISGGTPGILRGSDFALSDIQVTVHRLEQQKMSRIGFGVTVTEGEFELVTNEARGPLRLEPGEYRFTLESAGAPVLIPAEYTQAETTPLRITWSKDDETIDLEASLQLEQ